jgi:hypothetical protein
MKNDLCNPGYEVHNEIFSDIEGQSDLTLSPPYETNL